MITKLTLFKFWIVNILTFSKPSFLSLEYVDFILEDDAIFLISWRLGKAYRIQIPQLNFQSFKKQASAYIAIPKQVNEITIRITNSWGSQTKEVKLLRAEISNQTSFNKLYLKGLNKSSVLIPHINFNKNYTQLKVPSAGTVRIKYPKINNLNYSQF